MIVDRILLQTVHVATMAHVVVLEFGLRINFCERSHALVACFAPVVRVLQLVLPETSQSLSLWVGSLSSLL